jgi:protein O-mannosyl-transferase
VMVAAPVLVLLLDRTLVSRSFAEAWRQRRGYYVALAGTWLVLGIAVATAGARGGTAGFTGATTWWGYVGLQARAVVLYLKLAFWPHPLVFDYGVDGVPLGGSLWVYLLVVATLAAATAYALVRRAGTGLCGAWFFAILAPSSSLVPVLTETVAEHRMYLPLAAVIVLGVVGLHAVWQRGSRWVLFAVAVALVGVTWQRNDDYRTGRQLWTDTVAKAPANSRAHYNLARIRFDAGEVAAAIHEYETAVALRPVFPSAHSNLANALVQTGDLPRARREVETALRQNPDLAEAHGVLGNIELLAGRIPEALAEHTTAVRLQPDNPDLRNNLGTALSRAGRLNEAVREYEAALQLRPDSALLHFNLANTCARMGRFADAVAHYERALALQPGYPRARENLARVRALSGTPQAPPSP